MRILFTTYSDTSLFYYQVTTAWALRTAGHEVRIASAPGFENVVTQSGLTSQPVGANRDPWRLARLDREKLESERAGLPEPYDVVDDPEKLSWRYLVDGYAGKVAGWIRMVNFPLIEDLVKFGRQWQPDLIVWEPNCFAGAIAARACGAAHARILYGLDVFGVTRQHYLRLKAQRPEREQVDPLADWLGSYARKYGGAFEEDLVTGQFTIDQFPSSLQLTADLHYLRERFTPYGGPAIIPKWLWAEPERPRVALTLGITAMYRFGEYGINVAEILEALSDLDVEVVATIADSARDRLPSIPDNVRVESYVPLHALAPTCDAIIHHGGAATLATASLYGVPQLAIPQHFDQPAFARALAAQGAGLVLPPAEVTGPAVRDRVEALLTSSAHRDAASRLRAEIHALPSPNDLVPHVEELTLKHRSR